MHLKDKDWILIEYNMSCSFKLVNLTKMVVKVGSF